MVTAAIYLSKKDMQKEDKLPQYLRPIFNNTGFNYSIYHSVEKLVKRTKDEDCKFAIICINYPWSNLKKQDEQLSMVSYIQEMKKIKSELDKSKTTIIIYDMLLEGKVTAALHEYVKLQYITNDATVINQILKQKFKKEIEMSRAIFYKKVKDVMDSRAAKTANVKQEVEFISNICKNKKPFTILDMGCGMGRLSIPLAKKGFEVRGVDVTQELIFEARKRGEKFNNLVFALEDIRQLSAYSKNFQTAIIMWHTLCEFQNDKVKVLVNAYNAILRGGTIIFDVPDVSEDKLNISKAGVYTDNSAIAQYVGYVPNLEQIFIVLKSIGMTKIEYYQVKWGVKKIVFVCHKE